jgi:NitT/TauT family transport system substrate-binding protein
MKRDLKVNFMLLLLAILAAAVVPPALGQTVPTARKVRVQLNWLPEPEFGGIYEAERAGGFARAGLQVEILKGGPDVPALQMAAAGRVEFAVAAADEVVALREKGADVVALFATYQTSPQAIMVRRSRPVTGIKSLLDAGGTLIAQPGLAYLKWLKARYDLSKTKTVPYGSGAMAQFLDPSATDVAMQCFLPAEPVTARRRGVETNVFLIANTGFNPYAAVVVTRGEYLRRHPEECRAMVAALRGGWRSYLDDPAPANAVMARANTAMDLAAFAESAELQRDLIESPDTRLLGLGAMSEQRWDRLIKQLLDLGIIEVPMAGRECFAVLE